MNINLKNYQQKAVDELIVSFEELLAAEHENKVCVFQAPTGSARL